MELFLIFLTFIVIISFGLCIGKLLSKYFKIQNIENRDDKYLSILLYAFIFITLLFIVGVGSFFYVSIF